MTNSKPKITKNGSIQPDELAKRADDLRNTGRTKDAIVLYEELVGAWDAAGELARAGWALQMIGVCHKIDNATSASIRALEKAADYFRTHDIPSGLGNTLRDIAVTYVYAGEYAKARPIYEEAIEILKKTNDIGAQAITLAKLGELDRREGMLEAAREKLADSLRLMQTINEWFLEGTIRLHLGALSVDEGNFQGAIEEIEAAMRLFAPHREQQTRRYAEFYAVLATAYAHLGKLPEARAMLRQSLDILLSDALSDEAAAYLLRTLKIEETVRLLSKA